MSNLLPTLKPKRSSQLVTRSKRENSSLGPLLLGARPAQGTDRFRRNASPLRYRLAAEYAKAAVQTNVKDQQHRAHP